MFIKIKDLCRKPCKSRNHNPPKYIYIPPGVPYVHTCPDCGEKTTVYSKRHSWNQFDILKADV